MKLTYSPDVLAEGLAALVPVAATGLNDLSGMVLLTNDGIAAFGAEVYASLGGDVMAGQPSLEDRFVPAKLLAQIVSAIGGEEPITLTLEGESLTVTSAGVEASLSVGPEGDMAPPIAAPPDSAWRHVDWWSNLDSLTWAASPDVQRPNYHAIQIADGWAFGTDTTRVGARRVETGDDRTILPLSVVRSAEAVCGTIDAIAFDGQWVWARGANGVIRSTTVAVDPLDWQRAFDPAAATLVGTVGRADLAAGLRLAKIAAVTTEAHIVPRVKVEPNALGGLTLSSSAADGTMRIAAEVEFNGEPKAQTFNVAIFAGSLGQFSDDEVRWFEHPHPSKNVDASFVILADADTLAEATNLALLIPIVTK